MAHARLALAVVAVGLVSAATAAAADVPVGFISEPQLAAKAALVAGKPVEVWCALSDAAWAAEEAGRVPAGQEAQGLAEVGGSRIFLSVTTCGLLLFPQDPVEEGEAVEVLAHEARHTAGDSDEGVAECNALAAMDALAWQFVPAHLVEGVTPTKAERTRLAKMTPAARRRWRRLAVARANAKARARMHAQLLEGSRVFHESAVAGDPRYAGPCDS